MKKAPRRGYNFKGARRAPEILVFKTKISDNILAQILGGWGPRGAFGIPGNTKEVGRTQGANPSHIGPVSSSRGETSGASTSTAEWRDKDDITNLSEWAN